eukprot:TRINITY_DN31041_c0_g1_i2.p1 TRINITY_DN31041_c0_g1~~TRINITY_DN31041_c0_g1_i2.p1  ORF type:complete len:525 (+),score=77.59 TRINITY_DN31041_c0_g1_i2:42-1616(+)
MSSNVTYMSGQYQSNGQAYVADNAFSQTSDPGMTCPGCGNIYMADSNFCRRCGRHREGVQTGLLSTMVHSEPVAVTSFPASAVASTPSAPGVARYVSSGALETTAVSQSVPASPRNTGAYVASGSVTSRSVTPRGGVTYVASSCPSQMPPGSVSPRSVGTYSVSGGISPRGAYAYTAPVQYVGQGAYPAGMCTPPQPHPGTRTPPPALIPNAAVPPPVLPTLPQPPSKLTEGMPDPVSIDAQKAAYNRSLEDQARQGEELLKMQQKMHADQLDQQKRQLISQIEQQAKQKEFELSQRYSQQLMNLQQEFQNQKMVLEMQAHELSMEYQKRKSQEDLMQQQYEMQRSHYEEQVRMLREIQEAASENERTHTHHQGACSVPPSLKVPPGMANGAERSGSFVPPAPPPPPAAVYAAPAKAPSGSYTPPAPAGSLHVSSSHMSRIASASVPIAAGTHSRPSQVTTLAGNFSMSIPERGSIYSAAPTQYAAERASNYSVAPTQYGVEKSSNYSVAPTQYSATTMYTPHA